MDLTDIFVCDKKLMEGRAVGSQAKIGDVARVHDDVVGLEEGVNRNFRALNRKVNQVVTRVTDIEADVNAGFATTATRVDNLGEMFSGLEQKFDSFKNEFEERENMEFDELNRSSGVQRLLTLSKRAISPRPIFPPTPPPTQGPVNGMGVLPSGSTGVNMGNAPLFGVNANQSNLNSITETGEDDDLGGEVNGLTDVSTSSTQPGVFSGEHASAFDEWVIKFRDYVDVFGSTWTEADKLNRLKLHLGAQARMIFENLLTSEKDNLSKALKNIRIKLDSPHFRELAYRKLAACYQRDGESVSDFVKRLVPLVNTTSVQIPPDAKEEMLCRCLVEKVRPEFQRSLQLVGPLIGRKNFDKLTAYIQELEVSTERDVRDESFGIHAMTGGNNQVPQGRFESWGPSRPNSTPLGPRPNRDDRDNERAPQNDSSGYRSGRNANFRRDRRNWAPQNDRRWNSRPFCHFCRRTGHEQYNCRERRRNYDGNRNSNNYRRNHRDTNEGGDQQLKGMIEDLAVQVHEMKMSRNYASADQNVKSLHPVDTSETPSLQQKQVKPEPKKISSWESKGKGVRPATSMVSTLLVMSLFCSASSLNTALVPAKPMICQTQKQATIWELPQMPSCSKISLVAEHTPIVENRELFVPNSIEFSTNAWTCRKIKKNARKYTTISGVPVQEKLDSENLGMSIEECQQMIKHKSCGLGTLKNRDNLWQTEYRIDLTPRFWLLGSFGWENVSSQNCFLFESRIDSHFGASSIVTPLGSSLECPYEKGQCILEDKTVLIWKVDRVKRCNFISLGIKKGKTMDKIWLADDGQLGLTFGNSSQIMDCGSNITVSDQGFGSIVVPKNEPHNRDTRSAKKSTKVVSDGVVTSSQLASQLTYLDAEITQTITFAFHHSFRSFCEFIEDNKRWAESAFFTNPTDLARSVFSNSYLVAKRTARTLLKVWPCVPLEESEYEFRPTKLNGECFEFLPVTIKAESRVHLAFIDPTTMIVTPFSKKGSCEEFRRIVIQIKNQILEIDQIEGKITSVAPSKIKSHEVKFSISDFVPPIESHAFHQLVLLNLTDIKEHAFVTNMVRVSQMSYKIQERDSLIRASVSQEWEEVENRMIGAVVGDYRKLWLITVSVVVFILSLDFVLRFGVSLAEIYAGNGRLGKLLFGPTVQEASKRIIEMRPIPKPNLVSEEIYEEPIPRAPWPPRVRTGNLLIKSFKRMSRRNTGRRVRKRNENICECAALRGCIGSLSHRAITVTTQVSLNGTRMKCLVDTGSSTSVAPKSLAQCLGTKTFKAEAKLMSASGHPVHVTEATRVNLKIGNESVEIIIYLFENELSWTMKEYNFILGCDALMFLPPITIDIRNAQMYISDVCLAIGSAAKKVLFGLKVCASETVELGSNEQRMLRAEVKTPRTPEHEILFESLDQKLVDNDIGIIPTISNLITGQIQTVLTNPTTTVKRIFKGTCLGRAKEIIPTEYDGVFTEISDGDPDDELNSFGKKEVEIDPKFKINFEKSSVEGENLDKLKALCEEFCDIFSRSQYDLGNCTAGEHDIITTTEEPIASKPHRIPFKYRDELQKHIDQLLASGVMVESDTPWVSNIVLVQKKDGGLRPCIDFRKLNEVTVPDHFPLPRLESILEKVGKCRYYTSLDLASGYLQIRLSERASRRCGVITENKIYQMINLPFGLKNATSAFARIMAHVLTGLENVIAYVDDILIFTKSPDFDEHLESLRNVFERFRRFNLKLSPKKCTFASAEMEFLGYIVSENGYTPSLSKVETILSLNSPTSVKEVRQVVGMASFFRKHIPNFSTIVEPLTRLTRKEKSWVWEDEQQQAFEKIKKILSEKPVLVFPDYSKPFHIFCDASSVGQGGALMQWDEENKIYSAIAYCSRTLSRTERNWPPVQAELGAIIFSLRQFKPFIFMSRVELHTDHKPLAFLLKKAETHQHLARWLVELQNYNIKIVHVAGKQNTLADALSRIPHEELSPEEVEKLQELEDIAEFPICLALSPKPRIIHEKFGLTLSLRSMEGELQQVDIKKEQEDDPDALAIIDFLKTGNFPEDFTQEERDKLSIASRDLCLESDILYFHSKDSKPRLYIPAALRALIFDSFHTNKLGGGHMDLSKTLKKCQKYFWPRMHADIVMWCKQCVTCQLRHSPNPPYRAEMCMPPVNTLFAKVGLDLAGPFPKTEKGNKHILNIVCWFTKFVISVPLPDAKAQTIASAFLKNCYLRFGGCTELITDNATAFTSEFFKTFCSMLYINKTYAIPHWSQGNAVTERTFRTFHNILAKYISKDQPDFDEHLEFASFCYNTSVHRSTNETPFFLMYGRDPIFCVDLILDPRVREPVALTDEQEIKQKIICTLRRAWHAANEANREAQEKSKAYYDRLVRNPTISVGDRVLLRNYSGKLGTSKKFHLPWKGVFRVLEIDGVRVTIISCNCPQSNPRVVHINQLKKCFEPLGPIVTMPNMEKDEEEALTNSKAEELINEPGFSHKSNTRDNFEVGGELDIPRETDETEKIKGPRYNLRKNPKAKRLSFGE